MADDIDGIIDAHRLVGEKERARVTGISRSGWRNLEARARENREELVPGRIALSPGKSGWRLADLIRWVQARPTYVPPPAPAFGRGRKGSASARSER